MPKKAKKKSWKEKQRERQIRQQRTQEAYQRQKALDAKRKPRKFPIQKIFVGVAIIILILTAYAIWQYTEGQKPPEISGSTDNTSSGGLAPDFTLQDINGASVSLSQFKGNVIGIHFMAVGCGGQLYEVNQYQLTQLRSLCNSFCSDKSVAFLSVAVATCENSLLDEISSNYGVTWTVGNDYADGVMDIVDAYIPLGVGDGTVVLIDKTFNVAEVYRGGVAANTLSSKISQLLEA